MLIRIKNMSDLRAVAAVLIENGYRVERVKAPKKTGSNVAQTALQVIDPAEPVVDAPVTKPPVRCERCIYNTVCFKTIEMDVPEEEQKKVSFCSWGKEAEG